MLTLRERIIVLYATAPEGFSATNLELMRKFNSKRSMTCYTTRGLATKGVLTLLPPVRGKGMTYAVGPALKQELGADA